MDEGHLVDTGPVRVDEEHRWFDVRAALADVVGGRTMGHGGHGHHQLETLGGHEAGLVERDVAQSVELGQLWVLVRVGDETAQVAIGLPGELGQRVIDAETLDGLFIEDRGWRNREGGHGTSSDLDWSGDNWVIIGRNGV